MRCLFSGRARSGCRYRPAARLCAALTAAVLSLSACAQSQSYPQSNAGIQPIVQRVAVAAPPRIVLEDDGLPRQHPPRRRHGPVADDPSEPFSPNYGPEPRPSSNPDVMKPNWQPVSVRRASIDPRWVEAVIARAVAAHELRNQ